MAKIIIAERDRKLCASVARLTKILNLELCVAYNEEKVSNLLVTGDVLAVMINIEIESIDVTKISRLCQYISNIHSGPNIPVFFIYRKESIAKLKNILLEKRDGDLLKPFTIIDVFTTLKNSIELNRTPDGNEIFTSRLEDFNIYHNDLIEWLQQQKNYA